jgi:hypothetical protein
VNVIIAGRTSYFYCVSVQEGSGPCEVGEGVGLKTMLGLIIFPLDVANENRNSRILNMAVVENQCY